MSKVKFVQTLLDSAAQLRRYRNRRADAVSLAMRLGLVRNRIRKEAHGSWDGGYVFTDDGRLIYVPAPLDVMGGYHLLKPPRANRFVAAFLKPGDVVLDVGANMGDWTMAAAQAVGPEGRVLAFEPTPHVAGALAKTARINRLKQVKVFEMALAAEDGEMEFSVERENSGGSRLGAVADDTAKIYDFKRHFERIKVKARTVDTVIDEQGIERVDVMKIDVEGFESSVLKGALRTLERDRPALYLETGHENREARGEIARMLRPLGYDIVGVAIAGGMLEATWDDYLGTGAAFADRSTDMLLMA